MIGEGGDALAYARCLHRFHLTPQALLSRPLPQRAFVFAALDMPADDWKGD